MRHLVCLFVCLFDCLFVDESWHDKGKPRTAVNFRLASHSRPQLQGDKDTIESGSGTGTCAPRQGVKVIFKNTKKKEKSVRNVYIRILVNASTFHVRCVAAQHIGGSHESDS